MDSRGQQTRQNILDAAMELFAEHGLSGVSVRTIAQAADVNVAAINYYFGGKEELYFEVIRYVFHDCGADLSDDFKERIDAAESRDELLELFHDLVRVKVSRFLDDADQRERFKRLLLLRVFLDDELAKRMIGEFQEEHKAQVNLFLKLNPELTNLQAEVAVFSMIGQLAFYVFARIATLQTIGIERYDEQFRDEVAKMILMNLTTPLKL